MLKKELRNIYKAKRAELSSDDRAEMSASIIDHLRKNLSVVDKTISLFLPIERHFEIDTNELLQLDTTISLPVVKGDDELRHIQYQAGETQIEISDWGIPEPLNGKEIDPELIDIVFVPLLAVDSSGHRVGYGAGFYDKFLSQCRSDCQFIGLSFFEPIDKITDTFESDIALHACITPAGFKSF